MLDYLAYDRKSGRLWVPAGNTGRVDVIDTRTDQIKHIEGFSVARFKVQGKLLPLGPSSVAIGNGMVYVGNRADSKICGIHANTLKRGACFTFAPPSSGIAASPSGLIYIAATRELWVTTGVPQFGIAAKRRSIQILSASAPERLTFAGKIPLKGPAEGYALDDVFGVFYTNLKKTGETIAIDVRKRTIISTWRPCDDPSGIAVDSKRMFVFVACGDRVLILDAAHDGYVLGTVTAGAGIDDIDYSRDSGLLYVAAAEAAQLTIAKIDHNGKPTVVVQVPTAKGARSVVAGPNGAAYLIDPGAGRILKVQRE
jgi:hypothetical protein